MKNVKLIILLFTVALLGGCGGNSHEIGISGAEEIGTGAAFEVTNESLENVSSSAVIVYVCGAVSYPGVYELTSDKRIADAVSAAGGFLPEAQTEAVNLAGTLTDGAQIRIPYVSEEAEPEDISSDSSSSDGRININTASEEELMTLTGVGEAKAEAIIEYRKSSGGFKTIEDIMNIEGIKEGVFNKIKDKISVN